MLSGFKSQIPSFESWPSCLGEKKKIEYKYPEGIGKIPVEKNAYLISQETSKETSSFLKFFICRGAWMSRQNLERD